MLIGGIVSKFGIGKDGVGENIGAKLGPGECAVFLLTCFVLLWLLFGLPGRDDMCFVAFRAECPLDGMVDVDASFSHRAAA